MRVSKHRTALLVITMLGALGTFAPAAMAAVVQNDGTELLVSQTDDNVSHDLRFGFEAPSAGFPNGKAHIIDSVPLTGGEDCAYQTFDETWMSCPVSPEIWVQLGGGDDTVTFTHNGGICYFNYTLLLGDGRNENTLAGCSASADLYVGAGSGNDTLRGGSPGTVATIYAGGGDDNLRGGSAAGRDIVHGEEGEDILQGEGGNDDLFGEGGNDEILGGAGNDVEDGGPGDDFIGYYRGADVYDNDQGADTYRGGSGHDSLIFEGHAGGMAISLDGVANDGEGDNVGSDFELYVGTGGNDVFRGNAAPNHFDGDGGNDESHGGGGDDYIQGGDGSSTIFGDAGNDLLEGDTGPDRIEGGAGRDRLFAVREGCKGYKCDFHLGDALFTVDGEADTADCSGGGTANVDQFDNAFGLCNTINRTNVACVGCGGGGGLAKASFRGSKRSIKVSRKGTFTYSFRAGAAGKAAFRSVKKVRVSKRARVTLASKSFKKPKSGKVKLKVKLSRKALKILRRNRKIKTKVTVTLKSGGRSSTASATVTLKR